MNSLGKNDRSMVVKDSIHFKHMFGGEIEAEIHFEAMEEVSNVYVKR